MKKLFKTMGILFLCIAISGVGFLQDALLREKIKIINATEQWIGYIHNRIQYTHCDIFTLFSSAANEEEFKKLTFLIPLLKIRHSWTPSKIRQNIPKNFPQSELLISFLIGLGQTDVVGQLEHCETYKNLFAEKSKIFSQEHAEKGKLYRALSSFFAAGLAIVLI